MLAAKYLDQKGFTKEEYDKVADAYLAKSSGLEKGFMIVNPVLF